MKLLLVDDHALFLQSLKVLLSAKGYDVIGTASNGMEALKQARLLNPDLILMDIDMPVCDGLSAMRLIKAEMPHIKIVMLTVSTSDENLFDAIKSGASGYLLKSQSADRFLEMVSHIENGGAAIQPDLAARLLNEFARQAQYVELPAQDAPSELTPRQMEILTLVTQGHTYAQIGEVLHLSEPTIRYHINQILERLHLKNRSQLIAYAARHGMMPSDKD
jgi:two-component system NarL family response regulator